tara:strand:- start:1101 stop:1562 length:462 start_codon:yes stop_codon:yes gene_type:complete
MKKFIIFLLLTPNLFNAQTHEEKYREIEKNSSIATDKMALGDYYGAIIYFDKCIDIEPESFPGLYYYKAQCNLKLSNYREALTCINNSIRIDPYYGEYHNFKGYVKFQAGCKGEYSNCCKDFKKAGQLGFKRGSDKYKIMSNNSLMSDLYGCD